MPWGRLDDSLYDHPKLDYLPEIDRLAGVGLWAIAISWCNRFLTDGHIPRSRIGKLGGSTELADRLVAAGLFDDDPAGYNVHGFLVFNDSREQIEDKRKKETERKAAWRAGKRPGGTTSTTEADVPPSVPSTSRRPSRAESPRLSRVSPRASRSANPVPSRPVPSDSDTTPQPPASGGRSRRRTNGVDGSQYDALARHDSDDEPELDDLDLTVGAKS
jgi:hypothetical protein